MRSTALLTSALAVGAIAKPLRHQHKRYIVTTVDLDVVTVTKYVTAGYEEPAPTPAAVSYSQVQHGYPHSHSEKPAPPPSSAYTPPPVVVSTPAYTPPAPSPTPSKAAPSQPAASSSKAAAPSSGGDYSGNQGDSGKSYADALVYYHNIARANHNHDKLSWDDSLASVAQEVTKTCNFSHWAPVKDQGQNLYAASGSEGIGVGSFNMWYAGEFQEMNGKWGANSFDDTTFEKIGHLTQMVWKDTKKVGCATLDCASQGGLWMYNEAEKKWKKEQMKYTVCQYSPPGNYAGQYSNQVGQPVVSAKDAKDFVSSLASKVS